MKQIREYTKMKIKEDSINLIYDEIIICYLETILQTLEKLEDKI